MSYTVYYSINGETKDISDFVTSIQYGGDNQSAVRKMDISLISGTDTYIPKLDLKNGELLTLLSQEKELIRTVIFKQDRDDKGSVRITGYTQGIYLTKNKDTLKFEQMKASQIVREICGRFGIPEGSIEDTGIILDKLLLRDKTLWDMLLISLTETTKRNGKKYRIFFKEGKLNVCERKKIYVPVVIEGGINLLSANRSVSIEEMKNQIKVVGKYPQNKGEKELSYTARDESMHRLYGVMQEIREESGDRITESTIRQTAETLLKDLCKEGIQADVETLGIDDVEAGMVVYVVESAAGLTGSYYIEQDDHSIEGNKHTMRLKLALTDEVPELEYEEGA